jgi:hypothetical protein
MCEEGRFGKPRVGKGNRQRIQGSYVVAVVAPYLLFYSFNPNTWGHSPKDIEHVKYSYDIYIRHNIYSA